MPWRDIKQKNRGFATYIQIQKYITQQMPYSNLQLIHRPRISLIQRIDIRVIRAIGGRKENEYLVVVIIEKTYLKPTTQHVKQLSVNIAVTC